MNSYEYYEPCFLEVKKILRKKGVSWKKAVVAFPIEEMVHWFKTGNMCRRVAEAVLLRIKDNKKEN